MFNQNNEEKKLDWMYKGPTSLVDREEYLLGRAVDKTLEHINEEDKQIQQGIVVPTPKNRVEHECIPPSIRDFNKFVQAEQVDLSAKLQEDPLVAIKKREEESRRQFLQNPVQLKKLQKALKAQQIKKDKKKKKRKKKSKHSDESDSDLEAMLAEKLLGKVKRTKEERDLDTILIHKYEEFKHKLTEKDLQDVLNGKMSDSDDSSEEEKPRKKSRKAKYGSSESETEQRKHRKKNGRRQKNGDDDSADDDFKKQKKSETNRSRHPQHKSSSRHRNTYSSDSDSEPQKHKNQHSRNYYDDSDFSKNKKVSYGIANSAVKIPFTKRYDSDRKADKTKLKAPEPPPPVEKHHSKKISDEKEALWREMMTVQRDRERSRDVKRYREKEEKERREQDFEFINKQLLKAAQKSSIERIKASSESETEQRKHRKKKDRRHKNSDDDSSDDDSKKRKNLKSSHNIETNRSRHRSRSPQHKSSSHRNKHSSGSNSDSEPQKYKKQHSRNYHSDDSDSSKNKKVSYGLVTSEGIKIPFTKKHDSDRRADKPKSKAEPPPPLQKHHAKKLSEEEKEALRREMMNNAVQRDKERSRNVKRYREKEEKERREQDFDPEFIHKQLVKSAQSSSVESRIKANLNNIQRSSRDMDKHFSRR